MAGPGPKKAAVIKKENLLPQGSTRVILQGSGVEINDWQDYRKTKFTVTPEGVIIPINKFASDEVLTAKYGEHYVRDGFVDVGVSLGKAAITLYSGGASTVGRQMLIGGGKIIASSLVDDAGQALKGQEITWGKNIVYNTKISSFKGKKFFDVGIEKGFLNKSGAVIINTGNYVGNAQKYIDKKFGKLLPGEDKKLGTFKIKGFDGQNLDFTISNWSVGKTFEGSVTKNLFGKSLTDEIHPGEDLNELTRDWQWQDRESYRRLTEATLNGQPLHTPFEAVKIINGMRDKIGYGEAATLDLGTTLRGSIQDAGWVKWTQEFQAGGSDKLNYAVSLWNKQADFSSLSATGQTLLEKTIYAPASSITGVTQYVAGTVTRAPEFFLGAVGSVYSEIVSPFIKIRDYVSDGRAYKGDFDNTRVFVTRNPKTGTLEIIGAQSDFTGPFGEESLSSKIKRIQRYGSQSGATLRTLKIGDLTSKDLGGIDPNLWGAKLEDALQNRELKSIYIGREIPDLFKTPEPKPEWTNEQTQNIEEDVIVRTENETLSEVVVVGKPKNAVKSIKKTYQKDKYGNTWIYKNGVPVGWKDGKSGKTWSYDAQTQIIYENITTNGKPDVRYPSTSMLYKAQRVALEKVDLKAFSENLKKGK